MSVNIDSIFLNDIMTYLHTVKDACKKLLRHLNILYHLSLKSKNDLLCFLSKKNLCKIKVNNDVYMFHGSGCSIYYSDGNKLQWDFDNGNWCGIDTFFVYAFLSQYRELEYSREELIKFCEDSVAKGLFAKHSSRYSILLYRLSSNPVSVPRTYDRLEITYRGEKHIVERNKLIDRFARKATCCYSEIEDLGDNYELCFYLDNKEIYRLFYNDIAYPQSAVDIMSRQIIPPIFGYCNQSRNRGDNTE